MDILSYEYDDHFLTGFDQDPPHSNCLGTINVVHDILWIHSTESENVEFLLPSWAKLLL